MSDVTFAAVADTIKTQPTNNPKLAEERKENALRWVKIVYYHCYDFYWPILKVIVPCGPVFSANGFTAVYF